MAMVASPSVAATVPPPPPTSGPPPQFHVLAVDDSHLDRKLIEGLLRTSSCHVTAVDSVTKALEFLGMQQQGGGGAPSCSYCHHHEINLIITDYCMPGMTGYDLLKTVRGSGSPIRDIPVVIMSSENVPARINRCLEEGADDFFLKPVKLSDVTKLRPHLLRTKSTTTPDAGDRDNETRTSMRGQAERPKLEEVGQHEQQLTAGGGGGDAGVADAADFAATDSPRSNKRKAAPPQQPTAGSVLHDHRTRTTTYALPLL